MKLKKLIILSVLFCFLPCSSFGVIYTYSIELDKSVNVTHNQKICLMIDYVDNKTLEWKGKKYVRTLKKNDKKYVNTTGSFVKLYAAVARSKKRSNDHKAFHKFDEKIIILPINEKVDPKIDVIDKVIIKGTIIDGELMNVSLEY